MRRIYTACHSIDDALALARFIVGKGYEGVQNDSFRYCKICIEMAFEDNARHFREIVYVGVNYGQLVVGRTRRFMRKNGSLTYIEKQRVFKDKLTYEKERIG